MDSATRQRVIAEAMTWLRTPYHHAAGIKGAGVDCAYLLIRVYHACGLIPDIDPRPYPPDWHHHRGDERYLGWVQQYAHQVEEPAPGDIALYRFGRCISHGAIVLDAERIIHAKMGVGCVLGELNDPALQRRFAGWWRLSGEVQ